MNDQIVELELFCERLYEATDPAIRTEAEKSLVVFSNSPDCLQKCQVLLERATSSYSILLAATTLTKLVSRGSNSLALDQRIDIKNYLLNYFATRSKLAPFVIQALSQLLVKLTKYGWFESKDDNFVFRTIANDIKQFLQGGSIDHCIIGLKLLSELVSTMNQSEDNLSMAKNRKISGLFRDSYLYGIYTTALNLLKQMTSEKMDLQNQQQTNMLGGLLTLLKHCLNYDFIGTSFEESADDFGTIHVPTQWKETFLDFTNLHLFIDLYLVVPIEISPLAIGCFVQWASIRRSLFDSSERPKYLQELMNGVKKFLDAPQRLENTDNYHEFCRLLSRIKANHQLGEILKTSEYKESIQMITKFTVTSLSVLNFAPNSLYYLLNMWQKMVASCPFVKENDAHLLEQFTPQITEAYVTSRLESVKAIVQNGADDPLEDASLLHQQLDQISTIARCEYLKSCNLMMQAFDQSVQSFQETRSNPTTPAAQIAEGQITWLVYIIAYCIGSRVSFSSTDDHDRMDGELSARILQLMNLTDMKLPQIGSEKLEWAFIGFLDQFKKIYIGEQVNKSTKVYQLLGERLGINDESAMLELFTRKLITNMKYWSHSERIIKRTLTLLSDLSVGYSSVRKLVKLETIQFVLNNHTPEHFPFLGAQTNVSRKAKKCREKFYIALGRFLLVDIGDEEERFFAFVRPLTVQLENISQRLDPTNGNSYPADETESMIIGVFQDLKGLSSAFNSRTSFQMFFDWIEPKYTHLMPRLLEISCRNYQVTQTVLQLARELTQNRSQRLNFDVMVPNGVLLFRLISKTLVTFGSYLVTLTNVPTDQLYDVKIKPILLCFSMLRAALAGGYVNFGVLRLYGDDALENALGMFIKLLGSIEQKDIMEYPKLGKSYYTLIEVVVEHHIDQVCKLDPQMFLHIISTLSEGLVAIDLSISTGCCAALDHIVTFLFTNWQKATKSGNPMNELAEHPALKILELRSEIFQQMLATVVNIVMFEECRNMWSMSRPLLGLILLNEKVFTVLEERITQVQENAEKQQKMATYFRDLMDGVERSLSAKNRDRFTQNLSSFRSNVKAMLGVLSGHSIPVLEMMGFTV
uniref:Importin N-terminal domain-containing protein n=1 Tax=Clytia hemisphaerica TaxID=252671 RepID=A0A7M5UYT3_9CNID